MPFHLWGPLIIEKIINTIISPCDHDFQMTGLGLIMIVTIKTCVAAFCKTMFPGGFDSGLASGFPGTDHCCWLSSSHLSHFPFDACAKGHRTVSFIACFGMEVVQCDHLFAYSTTPMCLFLQKNMLWFQDQVI